MSKLIRDNIIEIIKKGNKKYKFHVADDEEYKTKLSEKLREECEEYIKDQNTEELADILEVVYALGTLHTTTKDDLEVLRKEKAEKRGGFTKKHILDES